MAPYYTDEQVTLYHGDSRDIVPALTLTADLIVADPPYGETSLEWDRWPDGWPDAMRGAANAMWCFGSLRMFLDRRDEFAPWRLSQDVVWEKQQGTGWTTDRFMRVHEHALHWYRGDWASIHHETPRAAYHGPSKTWRRDKAELADRARHRGVIGGRNGYTDDGTRLMQSVFRVRNLRQAGALHPSEKPVGLLDPLIRYGCPEGGTVLDPFAGSGSTAEAARLTGRKTILIEADERYCDLITSRMSQTVIDVEVGHG